MSDFPFVEDRQVRRGRPHLDERDAELLLVLREQRQRARQRLEHELARLVPGALHRLAQVHRRRRADRHQIHLRLEPHADHPDGIANPLVAVHAILLRNGVQKLAVAGNRLRPRHLVRAGHVGLRDLLAVHCDDAVRRHGLDVLPGDARVHLIHARARHALGVLERLADRARRFLDVGDDAAAHPRGARLPDTENSDRGMLRKVADDLGDHGGRFSRADVEARDEAFGVHWTLAMTCSRKRRSSSDTRAPRRARSASTGMMSAKRLAVTSRPARTRNAPI